MNNIMAILTEVNCPSVNENAVTYFLINYVDMLIKRQCCQIKYSKLASFP